MNITKEDFERERVLHEKLQRSYILGYKAGVLTQTMHQKKKLEALIDISKKVGSSMAPIIQIEIDLLGVDIETIEQSLKVIEGVINDKKQD